MCIVLMYCIHNTYYSLRLYIIKYLTVLKYTFTSFTLGSCNIGGLYYNDATSIIICTNTRAFFQPCPPGTKNSGLQSYITGTKYTENSFCDVNLIALGEYKGKRDMAFEPQSSHRRFFKHGQRRIPDNHVDQRVEHYNKEPVYYKHYENDKSYPHSEHQELSTKHAYLDESMQDGHTQHKSPAGYEEIPYTHSDSLYHGQSYTDDTYIDDSYTDDTYIDGSYEDDTYFDDSYEYDSYIDDSYEDDSYEDDTYIDDSYEDDSYEDDTYIDDSYEDDSYEDDSYEDDSYKAEYGQTSNYKHNPSISKIFTPTKTLSPINSVKRSDYEENNKYISEEYEEKINEHSELNEPMYTRNLYISTKRNPQRYHEKNAEKNAENTRAPSTRNLRYMRYILVNPKASRKGNDATKHINSNRNNYAQNTSRQWETASKSLERNLDYGMNTKYYRSRNTVKKEGHYNNRNTFGGNYGYALPSNVGKRRPPTQETSIYETVF